MKTWRTKKSWWVGALAFTVAVGAFQARAESASEQGDGFPREVVLNPTTNAAKDNIELIVRQAIYPNLPPRFACRMEIKLVNRTDRRIDLSAQLGTFDKPNKPVEAWLVPTGDMRPGESVKRVYSCSKAERLEVSRDTQFGWPKKCTIDGSAVSPCPVALKIISSLPITDPR